MSSSSTKKRMCFDVGALYSSMTEVKFALFIKDLTSLGRSQCHGSLEQPIRSSYSERSWRGLEVAAGSMTIPTHWIYWWIAIFMHNGSWEMALGAAVGGGSPWRISVRSWRTQWRRTCSWRCLLNASRKKVFFSYSRVGGILTSHRSFLFSSVEVGRMVLYYVRSRPFYLSYSFRAMKDLLMIFIFSARFFPGST